MYCADSPQTQNTAERVTARTGSFDRTAARAVPAQRLATGLHAKSTPNTRIRDSSHEIKLGHLSGKHGARPVTQREAWPHGIRGGQACVGLRQSWYAPTSKSADLSWLLISDFPMHC